MFNLKASGSFDHIKNFLKSMDDGKPFRDLDRYGQMGVNLLSSATPVDTGETAHSWGFETKRQNGRYIINWFNTHKHNGVHIAIILQYGHGTGTGGWVDGRDYINPAMRPLFDKMVDDIWRQVING